MVDTGIQHIPVMRDQDKTLFGFQVILYQVSGLFIQMICRFINQKKIIFTGKQNCEHDFGTLPEA